MKDAAGGVTRADILAGYEMILQRSPEGESAYAHHARFPDRFALGRVLLASQEFRQRNPAPPELQPYTGYRPAELAVVHRFGRCPGPGRPGFVTNFLGARARTAFVAHHAAHDGTIEAPPLPPGDLLASTAEWIGVLKAVLGARDSWRILELGAGYGPWMVSTALAARQRGITDIHLHGVEGDAGHVAFLRQHLEDNGLDPAAHRLLHGVVGTRDGTAAWATAAAPAAVYGGRPLGPGGLDEHGVAHRQPVAVPMFGIAGLLAAEPAWDLVHMDLQGGEAEVCRAALAALTERVRWVVVGTHSRLLDGEVMAAFHAAGWALENERPTIMAWRDGAPTLEAMVAADGVQVWRNPCLAGPVP